MIENFFPKSKLEKVNLFKLKLYDFHIPNNYVVYFETQLNAKFTEYIEDNYEVLKNKFKELGKNFIYFPSLNNKSIDLKSILEFYIPQISNNQISEIKEALFKALLSYQFEMLGDEQFFTDGDSSVSKSYRPFLNFLNYEGSVKSGFLFQEFDYYAIESPREELQFADFFYNFFNSIKELSEQYVDFDDLPLSYDDLYEFLDEEAKSKIEEMKNGLHSLKNNGQLLFVLPILKDILDKYADEIKLDSISTIVIDNDFKINLPYFDKEIVLSSLTKSIYFLFLNHPEGIYLKELINYKKELLSIYKYISKQLDHDKIIATIDDLVNPESNAIYTHISRIKSAVFKIMDSKYARSYVIQGRADEIRSITFSRESVHWDELFLWEIYNYKNL